MLKSQDCIILVKLLAHPETTWKQRELSTSLCISLSEVNGGIKRLAEAGLLRKNKRNMLFPNIDVVEEFLVSALKFFFPGRLGEYTRGIPTSIAAPPFNDKISTGSDPLPVWPDAVGETKGVALAPIHPSIPKSLRENPDDIFYELLVLIDVIRSGRARERNIAITLLKKRLQHAK